MMSGYIIANGMNGALISLVGGLLLSAFTPAIVIITPIEYRLIPIIMMTIINFSIIYSENKSSIFITIGYLFGYGIVVYFITSIDIILALQMFAPYIIAIVILICKGQFT